MARLHRANKVGQITALCSDRKAQRIGNLSFVIVTLFFPYGTGIMIEEKILEGMVFMFSIGMPEVVMILVIALVVFGPGKLPEVGKAIGKGMNEFRRATSLDTKEEPKSEPMTAGSQQQPPKAEPAAMTVKAEEKK